MTERSAAVANDDVADEAARDFLAGGGTAVGAVLAGFFAAAGAHSGVLLSPLTVLLSGGGAGARAFDGRLRQPGLGAKRPRGFKSSDEVPDAARVAIPMGVAALLVAYAYDDGEKLRRVVKAGVKHARRAGADGRSALLSRIAAVGAAAMTETSVVRPFLRAAGPSELGLVTPADFQTVPVVDTKAVEGKIDSQAVIEAPWAHPDSDDDGGDVGIGCAVCAVDARGMFAAIAYRRVLDGFPLEELELEAPLAAVPVRRGVTRIPPGASLPSPAPLAYVSNGDGACMIAAPALRALDADAVDRRPLCVTRNTKTREATAARRR